MSVATRLWQYICRSAEHHGLRPHWRRYATLDAVMPGFQWFWDLCWWLARHGWIVGEEGGLYAEMEWRWPWQ